MSPTLIQEAPPDSTASNAVAAITPADIESCRNIYVALQHELEKVIVGQKT
jgi:hypothetical protein